MQMPSAVRRVRAQSPEEANVFRRNRREERVVWQRAAARVHLRFSGGERVANHLFGIGGVAANRDEGIHD